MAPKRKNETGSDGPTARDKKKQKTAEARSIAVQPSGKSTPSAASNNAVAGPSKSVRFDSMKGLPGSLNVEKFAEARSFEIKAMQDAMVNARSSATQRAWQQLPRHLRRRAASHDVRRVPLRLRDKARAEMDPMRKKAAGRTMSMRGKHKRVSRTEQLLKRQRNKSWLETHIWHSKRMKMEDMWGYRLAVEPTEKSFRPSHRASIHGSILHDASYYAVIELKGPENILRSIFDSCCDLQGPSPGAQRYLTGARICETHIYKRNRYPFDLIAPISILWQPVGTPGKKDSKSGSQTVASGHKRKGKEPERNNGTGASSSSIGTTTAERVVWVRVHPSVFIEVHDTLRYSASFVLAAFKDANPTEEERGVEIADLRHQYNIFEIMGPKASQVIKGALKPVADDRRDDFKKFWQSLDNLQSSGSVPRGMVVGFEVYDPRLNFPPKNAKSVVEQESLPSLSPASIVFPSSVISQSKIWIEDVRNGLRKPRYKKKDIDERKSKNLVPGTPLQALRQDDRIPVIMIQRSVESTDSRSQSSSHPSNSRSMHGWTVIVPAGWGMPFFSSLTYTGTRIAGQRERKTQSFEAGCVYFPRDYPSTASYDEYMEERAAEDKETWDRKPPAKRTNFQKIGTRSPWKPDWGVVLGLEEPKPVDDMSVDGDEEELIPAQRDDSSAAPTVPSQDPASSAQKVQPWLLRGADLPTILDKLSRTLLPSTAVLEQINLLRSKRKLDPLDSSIPGDDLWKSALITVKVMLHGRGSPEDLAMIYSIDDVEARKWMKAEALRRHAPIPLDESDDDETELSKLPASQDRIIGYITSANYSLSIGEGYGIGTIPVTRLFELKAQAERLRAGTALLVKIRNRHETICRAAHLEVIVQ